MKLGLSDESPQTKGLVSKGQGPEGNAAEKQIMLL